MNALDKLWDRLDFLTDELLDPENVNVVQNLKIRATEVAWCISQFHGGNLEYVRGMAMTRRRIRCAS